MLGPSRQTGRDGERHAAGYVAALMEEPASEAVQRLARLGDGDVDHARWELRYLRRALGLLLSGRDSLDDRTASLVGRALAQAVERDPSAAPNMRAISATQFNARLRVYRETMGQRGASRTPVARIGERVLGFAGGRPGAAGAEWCTRWVEEELELLNQLLRREFGTAELPEDVAPSAAFGDQSRAAG
jgi:hypothetical protein